MPENRDDSFDWLDSESTVSQGHPATAIYANNHGDIVVRQQADGSYFFEDPWIVFPSEFARKVAAAILLEAGLDPATAFQNGSSREDGGSA